MANYVGSARSNYFKVKDLEKFKAWCKELEIEVVVSDKDPELVTMLVGRDSDTGGWPNWRSNPEAADPSEDDEEVDLEKELSAHLRPGWVAVLVEVGSEKLRYLHGHATAVNSKGKTKTVNLNQIYKLSKDLGGHITNIEGEY